MARSPSRRGVLSGTAAAVAVASLAPRTVIMAQAAEPDAELIELCRRHIVNRDAHEAYGGHLPIDEDPLWAAYEGTRDAIHAAEPQTLAGMVAKARAAKAEAFNPHTGEDQPEYGPAEVWAWELVNDLLRLFGGEDA